MWAVQILASVLILWSLVRHARGERVIEAMGSASVPWLCAAVAVRALAQVLHEFRIWIALLPWKRGGVRRVLAVGFIGGMLNVVMPFRGGDFVTVALLSREEEIPASVSLASVGLVAFLEAALFGVFLGFMLLSGWSRWEAMLGAASARDAAGLVSVITLGGIGAAVVAVVLGRLAERGHSRSGAGFRAQVRGILVHTGAVLGRGRGLVLNLGAGVIHLAVTIVGMVLCLPAAGIHLEDPLLAAGCVLGVGAVAGLVLPPSLGAGPAASAVLVLQFFGIEEAQALAFAALAWFHASLPAVLLGIAPLWRRVEDVAPLLASRFSAGTSKVRPPPGRTRIE